MNPRLELLTERKIRIECQGQLLRVEYEKTLAEIKDIEDNQKPVNTSLNLVEDIHNKEE